MPPRQVDTPSGWGGGEGVAIGSRIPYANYCRDGIFADVDMPAPIESKDWALPPPGFEPLMAIRGESKVAQYLEETERLGIGQGTRAWADIISLDWYGKTYTRLNDYPRRKRIRCGMAHMSWSAWLAMSSAGVREMENLAKAGTVGSSVSASVSGTVAAVASQIGGAVGLIVAAVAGIVAAGLSLQGVIIKISSESNIAAAVDRIQMNSLAVQVQDRETLCAVLQLTLQESRRYLFAGGGAAAAIEEASGQIQYQIDTNPDMVEFLGDCPAVIALQSREVLGAGGLLTNLTPTTPARTIDLSFLDDDEEEEEEKSMLPWFAVGGLGVGVLGALFLRK